VWVVRDIVITNTGPWQVTANTLYVTDSGGAWIYGVQPPDGFNGRIYHWQGRQVLHNPQTLTIQAGGSGWSVRVSGYNLTAT
jgi:sugar lactone lactonase YvrE